jgi:hypothetical protein
MATVTLLRVRSIIVLIGNIHGSSVVILFGLRRRSAIVYTLGSKKGGERKRER